MSGLRQAGFPAGDADVEAGGLVGAFGRAQRDGGEAAAYFTDAERLALELVDALTPNQFAE